VLQGVCDSRAEARGQSQQARAELSIAMEMLRGMELTFWLPETEAALAQMDA
jgi:hypothetical protein